MSKYTTELRYICESLSGLSESEGYNNVNQVITASAPIIFPAFPIFDESYRLPLEKKILKHYYTREISEETYGLWKLRLDSVLNEIMPYYNQLYASELLANGYNPFHPVDISRTQVRDRNAKTENDNTNIFSNKASSQANDVSRDKYSDTPQGGLTGLENDTYLTNARKITSDNTASSSADGTNASSGVETFDSTDQYVESLVGSYGYRSNADELTKFRNTFLNIDKKIIDELAILFFGLW